MSTQEVADQLSLDVDEGDLAADVRPDATVTWGTDWTVSTIVDQLRRGRFDLEPAFQRRDVWNVTKRSRFIESLLLGIPVPQVILAERQETRGRFIVLDGKQRLRSLQRFAGLDGPPMRLSGLDVLTHLNGLTYEDLQADNSFEDHTASLENAAIRAVILRGWANESLLYLTFLRLNSNVVGLSPQELRRALHPGPFMDYVMQASSESGAIRKFLNIKNPDFRMRDAEILTRHISLTLRYKEYRGDLRRFLDESCQEFNSNWGRVSEQVTTVGSGLDLAIETTLRIFGKDAFKRATSRGFESRKNRAVLDVMAFYFQHPEVARQALDTSELVRQRFEEACKTDPDFQSALTSTTKSVPSLHTRMRIWGKELGESAPSAQKYMP
ncbi:uncharacterized protein DUF262 [Humibacillus xanthopallidus]|uniref:Uncharacterized protein DUF262 n=1 Tax=Humibacillus xanthopallidus TaxID=412689 RepID=A0A543PR43_9MICO|nr:DUF262 domain-containing protein [Humibacillus xanthopallidus]TQN46540.1 uncharacterized protein DUF262 [Humibacillus xanthopallidus]